MKDDCRIGTVDHEAASIASGSTTKRNTSKKPSHYKVICISMYTRDIDQLEAKVAELKRRGWTKANKSHMIRLALSQLDLDEAVRTVRGDLPGL